MKGIMFGKPVLLMFIIIQAAMKCEATFCADRYVRLLKEIRDTSSDCSRPANERSPCCEAQLSSLEERKRNHDILCPSEGSCRVKTTDGICCVFPFTYNKQQYYHCTTIDNGDTPWCATTSNYEKDQLSGNCNQLGGTCRLETTDGVCCVFPFTYKKQPYYQCTTTDRGNTSWCATTRNYDKDHLWGDCKQQGKNNSMENVAFGKDTAQSSTVHRGISSRAVDGNTNSYYFSYSCTHTVDMTNSPWWRVDLGEEYVVANLMITNRGDCCSDRLDGFEIRIGNSLDGDGNYNPLCGGPRSLGSGETGKISCPSPMKGRYVNIRLPGIGKILTLCEVQVFT